MSNGEIEERRTRQCEAERKKDRGRRKEKEKESVSERVSGCVSVELHRVSYPIPSHRITFVRPTRSLIRGDTGRRGPVR